MSQSTNATTNLQLHHNFRWVLCANHMEPVKGFLGRYLRRKLVASEVSANTLNNDLGKVTNKHLYHCLCVNQICQVQVGGG